MIKRFLNALGLATFSQFRELERDWFDNAKIDRKSIEEIQAYQRNQKTYLEHKFSEIETKSDREIVEIRLDELEDKVESIESIESRLDVLEDDNDLPLTKNNFDIDDHFDIGNYQSEIDEMINNEIAYSHSFLDSSEIDEAIEKALEEFKTANYEDPDVTLEQICSSAIEQIGGAILGLTHEDPILKEIIEDGKEMKEIIINDPLLTIIDEAISDED